MSDELCELAEASRKGRIGFPRLVAGNLIVKDLKRLDYDWAIPSFDFGFLFDNAQPIKQSVRLIWDESFAVGLEHLGKGTFMLPFPECAFIFHYRKTLGAYATTNVLRVTQDGNEIIGETFFKHHGAPSNMGGWNLGPVQFVLTNGVASQMEFNAVDDLRISQKEFEDGVADNRTKIHELFAATLMLNMPKVVLGTAPVTPKAAAVNRGREGAGLRPIPAARTVTVNMTEAKTYFRSISTGTGRKMPPHVRRGHYRHLRSGKVVPVKPALIHGGGSATPNYRIMLE